MRPANLIAILKLNQAPNNPIDASSILGKGLYESFHVIILATVSEDVSNKKTGGMNAGLRA